MSIFLPKTAAQNKRRGIQMRILAIVDIHDAIEVYKWLPEAVSDYHADVLILAGDLLTGGWEEE
jgi:predicted phosphodiesterase